MSNLTLSQVFPKDGHLGVEGVYQTARYCCSKDNNSMSQDILSAVREHLGIAGASGCISCQERLFRMVGQEVVAGKNLITAVRLDQNCVAGE